MMCINNFKFTDRNVFYLNIVWEKKSQNLQNSHNEMCLVLKFSTMKCMTESIKTDYYVDIIWTQESLPWCGPLELGNRTIPPSLIFLGDNKKLFFTLFTKLNPIQLIVCHWRVKSVYKLLQQLIGKKDKTKILEMGI